MNNLKTVIKFLFQLGMLGFVAIVSIGLIANIQNGDIPLGEVLLWILLFVSVSLVRYSFKNMDKLQTVLKESKKEIAILVFTVGLVFLFYWFQYRPSMIKSSCDIEVKQKVANIKTGSLTSYVTYYDAAFKSCLHRNGL